MHRKIFVVLLTALLFTCAKSRLPYCEVEFKGKTFRFEVASTAADRQRGLMFRKKLGVDEGMIFVYRQKQYLSFYMKNTLLPLDIAFLDENRKIVDIQSMEPLDETPIESALRAQFALEVNRGFFKRHNMTVGDTLTFLTPLPYIE